MHFRLLLITLATAAAAFGEDTAILRMEPGCFTGPPRSLLTVSANRGAWIQNANEAREWKERRQIGDKAKAAKAIAVLRQIPFSEEETKLLDDMCLGIIGPGRYYLNVTIGEQTTKVPYLADMTLPAVPFEKLYLGLPRFAGKQKKIQAVLAKVQTIHAALAAFLPDQNAADEAVD